MIDRLKRATRCERCFRRVDFRLVATSHDPSVLLELVVNVFPLGVWPDACYVYDGVLT